MPPAPLSPLTFRTLRLLADGEFHSGEALARTLRVSRTTVWKALQGLEEWGVTLFKVHGRGYRLVTPVDWLDVQQINRHLGAHQEELQVHVVDTVDSTNSLLLAEAQAGAPSGLAVAAELQTRGRGRRGRGWHTGLGDALTFSLLWRFRQGVGALHGLSLAVSVALVRALRALGATEAMVKWPNDVLWRQHKLAGVLIEVQGGAAGPSAAVIGDRHQRAPGRERPRPHRPAGRRSRWSRSAAASQPHSRPCAGRARRRARRVCRARLRAVEGRVGELSLALRPAGVGDAVGGGGDRRSGGGRR